ncbi:MAG: hypothetical protein M1832_002957 [Thelocarpon impressellum]|nr:MAG: hypothetical protein M1832_002957 [Thelocarpon impressellum]
MGASSKTKRDKKKDFQKAKLKVGKTKPKSANYTDTSFKARSIVVNQQSIRTSAPSADAQFGHHLSLLTSHSSSQCRDSLAYLTTTLAARTPDAPLPKPFGVILPELLPLLYHRTASVRAQLLKLLRTLPRRDVQDEVGRFIMHVRLGMTNIVADIRVDSVEVLSWLLDVAGNEVVSCPGGWAKLVRCFLAVLGWEEIGGGKSWSSQSVNLAKTAADVKAVAKQLQVFGQFLRVGIGSPTPSRADGRSSAFPLRDVQRHLLPRRPNCYAHLNLFGAPRDEDSEIYEDREDRQTWLRPFQPVVARGLEGAKKLGGEVGRAAALVGKTVAEGMGGYEDED